MKNHLSTLLTFSAAQALLLSTGCNKKSDVAMLPPPPPTVEFSNVALTDYNPVRRYNARIVSPQIVSVVPQVAGTITKVSFSEGSVVKVGDLLYQIDPIKYEAAVASAKASVAQAQANLDYAEKSFSRTKALHERKVASDDALDAATSARAQAAAALDAAKAALTLAEDNLTHTKIVSEIQGKVGLNSATVGNYVAPGAPALTTIVAQDPLRIVFSMGANDYARLYRTEKSLAEDFTLRVRLADGSLYEHEGDIEFRANTANVSTDTVSVYARVANPDGRLMPGTSVTVEIQAKVPAKVLAVPLSATFRTGDGANVWVLEDGDIAKRRNVKVSGSTEEFEVVTEGLAEGEKIIVTGTHKVTNGTSVNAIPFKR